MDKKIQYSSKKVYEGSAPKEFYGEGYFMHGLGSNYGSGQFVAYEQKHYLTRDRHTVEIFKSSIPELKSTIVLGCARGYMVQAFIERGIESVGVDISEWAITHGSETAKDFLYCGDICDLSEWDDKEFTLAVALDVLEHIKVPDLYEAISEAARVAKWVVINVPINPDDKTPDMSSGQDETHFSIYSVEWWMRQFMLHGMDPVYNQEHIAPAHSPLSRWADEKEHSATIYFKHTDPVPSATNVLIPTIATDGKDFKILWWSNALFVGTGYGVGSKYPIMELNKHYDVHHLGYYGLDGAALRINGVNIYPKLFDSFGIDACDLLVKNIFPDILITLFDIWIGESALFNGERNWFTKIARNAKWVPYFPIDHFPIPEPVLNQARQAYHCVAMSQFGRMELLQNGVECTYIPHGVNTSTYKPTEDKGEQKRWLTNSEKSIGFPLTPQNMASWENPEDLFIIGVNASNKDSIRKSYDRMFMSLRLFFEENPDARKDVRIHLHTYPDFPGGYPLAHYANILNVAQYIRYTKPFLMYCNLPEYNMAKMYQSFDLFLSPSRNEGFGIPIIEAQACGVPVIATDYTSMTELVNGHGWLVKPITTVPTMLLSNTAVPNEWELAEYIEEAYNSPDKRKKYGEDAAAFTKEHYDWDKVVNPLWVNLIEAIRNEVGYKSLDDRRIL